MQNEKTMRMFIAVDLPHAIIEEVQRIQRYFKKKNLFDGRYPNENVTHLTLKFLGNVSQNIVPDIRSALREISAVPMQATLDSVQFFGDAQDMKVIFIKIKSPFLQSFAQSIDLALMPWCALEKRDFVAHVTVARVNKIFNTERTVDAIHACNVNPLSFAIDSFVLKESILLPAGPEYHEIERYVLRKDNE